MVSWSHLILRLVTVLIFGLVGTSSCRVVAPAPEPEPPELPFADDLQNALDDVLQSNPHHLGISAAVNVPGYKTWTGVSGYSHANTPITADMLFDVGSVQKNFEAALVLKMAEEGRLSLDDPIANYLPAYKNVDGQVTIRQLLDHSSGIFNVFEHPDFPWVSPDVDYAKAWPVEEVFNSFVSAPYGPPGYAQHYSSTNYLLVTAIIEEVAGAAVPAELARTFLEPLQLEHTFVSMGQLPPANYSVAHAWVDIDEDGVLDDLHGIPRTWIATLSHPVMFATAEDLVRWLHALYYEGTVINAHSLAEMLTYPQTTVRDPDGRTLGLGVVNYADILNTPAVGHGGSSLGYSAAALYFPEQGTSVAWLINTGESPLALANQLMNQTWSEIFAVLNSSQELLPAN